VSRGLNWQLVEFTFSKGLNQKGDARSGVQAPEVVRLLDGELDDTGAVRQRKPYDTYATGIVSGGMISGCRRLYPNGSELNLLTNDALLSWSPTRDAWASKGTHLAVKTSETPRFVTTGDQVEGDRAELSGVMVHTWTELATATNVLVYYAITDSTTGAVITAPTVITSSFDCERPRVVATTTTFLLFYHEATVGLRVRSIDPAAGTLSAATTVLPAASFDEAYDVVKTANADSVTFAARRAVTTSYEVGIITAALAVTQATKARTCDGAIAVSSDPDGKIQVIRANGTNVQGDYLTGALVDTTVNQAIGTTTTNPASNIAACHRSDSRCYVFWEDEIASGVYNVKSNYVTTAGVIGTEGVFVRGVILASRAFTYGLYVFVNVQFHGTSTFASASSVFNGIAAQLQNTYFLYRDDAFLTAKAVMNRAGGLFEQSGWLPGVALTSGSTVFSWCGIERRTIPIGTVSGGLGYGDRGPRDITYTFDSNEARRVARLGDTLYIACGEGVLQYDGTQITEVGFHVAPWYAGVVENAAGSIAVNADFGYRFSYRWDNARGERERSTTATAGSAPIATQPGSFDVQGLIPLFVTHKSNRPVAVEVWRTAADPTDDAPFYLVTSQDPADTTGSNCYIANDTTLDSFPDFNDDYEDSELTTKESNPENGSVLENLAAPPCTLITASADRLFIAGIAGDPHTVRYSKLRSAGEVAAFHDALSVTIPEAGGDITGLAFLNETIVVFRETAIYALDGRGYDNVGGGANYEARLVSNDCGAVSHEAIALGPMGLIFKSSRGWYVLNRGWTTQYIGGGVCDYDGETVYAVHLVESQHQVRIVTSGRMLVWDYLADEGRGAWMEWEVTGALHGCVWSGTHHYLATSSVRIQAEHGDVNTTAGFDVEMLLHLGAYQGFARVRKILVLGEYRSASRLRVRVGKYTESEYFDDSTWTISPTTVGGVLQLQHSPSQQQHQAIRVRLTLRPVPNEGEVTSYVTEGIKLSAISVELGLKPGAFRHLPSTQRQ
jgi:hypothetical protein